MNRILTIITILIFTSSVYIIPTAEAITLGDIKSEGSSSVEEKGGSDQNKGGVAEPSDSFKDKKNDPAGSKKETRGEKVNPRLVCLLSAILPGGGHFYMNNDAKGMSFCLAAGAGYTLTGFFMVKTMLAERGSVAYKNYLLLTGFLLFITLVIHFVGIIEAYSDADEINRKNLFESGGDPYSVKVVVEK